MNQIEKQQMLDGVMAGLVMLGNPMNVGIPAWTLREMTTRSLHPVSARSVLGLNARDQNVDMVGEYLDKKGYQFSWGTVCERTQEIDGFPPVWHFEIFPQSVLMKFPQPALLEDLFIFMYQNHPLKNTEYHAEESYGNWSVMAFEVENEHLCVFRHWFAKIFLPKIMPDLISEAMLIIDKELFLAQCVESSPSIRLMEKRRFQLCGDSDSLTFNVRKAKEL